MFFVAVTIAASVVVHIKFTALGYAREVSKKETDNNRLFILP